MHHLAVLGTYDSTLLNGKDKEEENNENDAEGLKERLTRESTFIICQPL